MADESTRIDSALIAIGKTQSAAERTEKLVEGMSGAIGTLTNEVQRQGRVQAEHGEKLKEHEITLRELVAGVHHRPRAGSFTTEVRDEVKATHESIRSMAIQQAPLLEQAASNAPKVEKAAKKADLAAVVAGLGAIATLITTLLHGCH